MTPNSPFAYDFVAPQRICFGWGRRLEVGTLARSLGRRAFLICGAPVLTEGGVLGQITDSLRAEGVDAVFLETIVHEPEVEDVDRVAGVVRAGGVRAGDFILAVGGGAAIDLGKAVAAMATNDESPTVKDYLENVGLDFKLVKDPLPLLAMPTTAGTGAEATRNAVISSYDPPFKKSLRSDKIMPRIALVDPELSATVPPATTAASGMDAITQLIESFISRKAQPIPQALAMDGLRKAIPSIAEAVENGSSRPARENMAHAALLSGMALANSGLGMAHGVAAALGVHCRVAHGVACALMLPVALRVNRQVRQAELARLAHLLFGGEGDRYLLCEAPEGPFRQKVPVPFSGATPEEAVETLIREISTLCDRVGVPRRLSQLGVTAEQIPDIVQSSRGSSMSGNPRDLSDAELTAILEEIL
jgi:alcohol dehydrogenase class IV